MTSRTSHFIATVGLVPLLLAGSAAQADDSDAHKQACADAYQASQELRLDGKLMLAREKAAFCSQETCPGAVRSGCTKWLRELLDAQPTITIEAHDAQGNDISNVTVSIDGKPAADSLTGRPIEIDPGKHVIRLVQPGSPEVVKDIVVAEGTKGRKLLIDFGTPKNEAGARPPESVDARQQPMSNVPIVLGGVGVVSLGAFAVLAAIGTSEVSELRNTCGHTCPQSDLDSAKTKLIVGDIFLAAGVVCAGIAIAWVVGHHATKRANSTETTRALRSPAGRAAARSFAVTF